MVRPHTHSSRPQSLQQKLRNLLTRGDSVIVFQARIYYRDPAITDTFRESMSAMGLGELAFGDVFVRFPKGIGRTMSPSALLVQGFGRFGNMVIQTGNLRLIATRLGLEKVYFWENSLLGQPALNLGDGVSLRKAKLWSHAAEAPPRALFRTRAFSVPRFPEELKALEAEVVRQAISEAVFTKPPEFKPGSDRKLVIHLRSGDVFSRQPHRNYGQPPLSFYEVALEQEDWNEVVILAEDDGNPCLEGIARLCELRGLRFSIRGEDFNETVAEIASSRNLVMSSGTFCQAICWLVPSKRHLYFFASSRPNAFDIRADSISLVSDKSGRYVSEIMSGNWENRLDQRQLMLNYPKENLRLDLST